MSVKKFADLLKNIHKNKMSGTLSLVFLKGQRNIYVKNGEISYLKSDYPDEKLGTILINQGLIDEKELEDAIVKSKEKGVVLGEYLIKEKKITNEDLKKSLKQLFLMIIEACFLEDLKDINFVEKDIRIDKKLFMDIKMGNLVLETFRKIDHRDFEEFYKEHKKSKPKLNPDAIFDYKNLNLNPLEGFILSRVDGKLSLEEIKKIAFTEDKKFYKTIFALDFLGLIDFQDNKEEKKQEDKKNEKNHIQQTEQKVKEECYQKEPQEEAENFNIENFLIEVEKLYLDLPTINYYKLLNMEVDFDDLEELRNNYHRLIKKFHPDSHPELKEVHHKLQAIISTITKAYQTLKNKYSRNEYNKKMHITVEKNHSPLNEEKSKPTEVYKSKEEKKEELKKKIESFVKAGMLYDAITLLENGCQEYKDDLYFFKTLGNIYFRTPTKLKQAIKYLEKAHTMDRKDPDVIKNLAGAYKKVGFYREAYSYYKKLIHIDPDNKEALEFIEEVEGKDNFLSKIKNLFGKK